MKQKFPSTIALSVAQEIGAELRLYCEQIAIAGSLRRQKLEVGDVEILIQPRVESRPDGLFDRRDVDLAAEEIDRLVAIGMLAKRPNVVGSFTWGNLNKLAVHCRTGIPVDLFIEPNPLDWWRSLVIRTGSKETNIRLIMEAKKHGVHVGAYGTGLTDIRTGERIPCASEQEFFETCHCRYLHPKDRNA